MDGRMMHSPRLLAARVAVLVTPILAAVPALSAEPESASPAKSLFNGRTLAGWDGDPRFWRVEDGTIVGETTQAKKAEHNTFLIYRGGTFADFELTFRYQVTGYNSGVQYRSVDEGDWVVRGYQADFEDRWHKSDAGLVDRFSGMFFDERGRMFLGQRGEAVVVRGNPDDPRKPAIEKIATLGDAADLEKVIRRDDWNEYRIIAYGFQFTHIINGRVMAIGFDEDKANRRASGIIAFQLHAGPPMRIRVKDIRIREMPK